MLQMYVITSKPIMLFRVSRELCAFALLFGLSWPSSADSAKPLTTILLVARAELPDPNFKDSVVLVMNNIGPAPAGIIINRPTRIAVSHLFPDLEGLSHCEDRLYFGGPVEIESVSFLFRAATSPEHATQVLDGVYFSTDAELLRKLLGRDKPMDGLQIFIGHSGWAPGQLEVEITRGDWTLAPAETDAIFNRKSEHPWPEQKAPDAVLASSGRPSSWTGEGLLLVEVTPTRFSRRRPGAAPSHPSTGRRSLTATCSTP